MTETVQYIRCLMQRKSERKEREASAVKPFRGGVLFFHTVPDASGQYVACGAWEYFYTPYRGDEGGKPDALCPPHIWIKQRKDCYASGPMQRGVFFNRKFVDEKTIKWLEKYCEDNNLGLADVDAFNWSVLLASQPVGWSRGHYLYDEDSPKLVCALDFENQISRLAYDAHRGRNTRNDRLGYASTIYELCPCESRRRAGESDVPRCYHYADVKVKHLGEVIAVKSSRVDWGNQQAEEDEKGAEAAVDPMFQPKPKRIELIRFLPLDQFFQALSVATRRIPSRRALTVPNIKLWFAFLDGLHRDYIEAREKLKSYKLNIPIWNVFSGGSLARAVLHNLGIEPFRKRNPHIGFSDLSRFRAADCGGRICTLRTGEVIPAVHLDFKSEYPSACVLLGIQDLLIAERIDIEERFGLPAAVKSITLDKLFERLTWRELCGVALVKPNKDWLPFHGPRGLECRIIESGEPFWATLSDVCASILRTGRAPNVLHSLVLKPSGVQRSVRAAQFFGLARQIDPLKQDLFFHSILAKEIGAAPKAAVNSAGYGIHSQLNQEPGPQSGKFTLWCAGSSITLKSNEKNSGGFFPTEMPGEYYGPFGGLITGAGRLLLAMLELSGERQGLRAVYLNTDCAVFERPAGMRLSDFGKRINQIRAEFERISPYSALPKKQRTPFLKIEKQNVREVRKALRLVNFFAASPERYAEYTVEDDGEIIVRHLTLSHTSDLYDPPGYKPPHIRKAIITRDACDALETRRSLGDYWLVLLKLVERGLRGAELEDALRAALDKNKSLRRKVEGRKGETYADRIAEYLRILPPDDAEPASITRQYVIGKDPPDDEDEAPLFEYRDGKISPIYSGRMAAAARDQSNVVIRLYKARLLTPFIQSLPVPEPLKAFALSQIPERVRNGVLDDIHVIFETYIYPDTKFTKLAEAFLASAMKEQSAKGARATNEIKRARKTEACRKSGLSASSYAKAKRAVRRLAGSDDWLPQLSANDLTALDAMMNDWRASGQDYFSWRDEEHKRREREAAERREAWHARNSASAEDKASRRRNGKAEWVRAARAAAAEKEKIDVLLASTLAPEPVPGHAQDFRIGMAVVNRRDAEDAALRPAVMNELAASSLGLSPEERERIEKAGGKQCHHEQSEAPRISMLNAEAIAGLDYLSSEKPLARDKTDPSAVIDRNPQQMLESIEKELAGTATLAAVKALMSHLDERGINNVNFLNTLGHLLEGARITSPIITEHTNKNDGAHDERRQRSTECQNLEKSPPQINTKPAAAPS